MGKMESAIFFIAMLEIYPSELSDKIIIPKPRKKTKNLLLLYLISSFDLRINNNEIKIKTGK